MRLHAVSRAEATSPVVTMMYDHLFPGRDPVAEPGTADGTSGDWWTAFANSPDVLEHAVQGFLLYQSPQRVLDPVLRELAQCRVGWASGSGFVHGQHEKALRNLGVSEERIAAVADGAQVFSDLEQQVLAYVDCLVLELGRVPDEVFDPLLAALGDEALLELTYIASMYLQHAVMSKALRTESDA
jgi:alkylhydroperoxidase family enzyme